MQRRDPAGLLLLQAGAEQVGEQVVVAPPAAHLVQRQQEQAGPLDRLQHRLAIGAAGDGVAQLSRQPLQHRCLQQEPAHLVLLAVQHLPGQVVQDVTVAAAKRGHEPGHVGLTAHRQGGQLQAGHPPLRPGGQRRHGRAGQVSANRFAQQRRRLVCGEAQLSGPQLGQLPASPQPRQRQRRVAAAGQHEAQPRRQVLKQEHQGPVHHLGVDQVVVVEDHQHLVLTGLGVQLVDQGRHQPLEGRGRRGAEQRADLLADPRPHPVQRGRGMPPEPCRVVVAGVQRQPGHRPPAAPSPVGQQRRLAGPGRGAHQDQPPRQPVL